MSTLHIRCNLSRKSLILASTRGALAPTKHAKEILYSFLPTIKGKGTKHSHGQSYYITYLTFLQNHKRHICKSTYISRPSKSKITISIIRYETTTKTIYTKEYQIANSICYNTSEKLSVSAGIQILNWNTPNYDKAFKTA